MGTASVHKSWRKACGAIKDSATVGLAKVNGGGRERKDLDVAVVKATTHVERPPKERHLAGEIGDCHRPPLACSDQPPPCCFSDLRRHVRLPPARRRLLLRPRARQAPRQDPQLGGTSPLP